MATRRSQIQIDVLGLDDLRQLNTAMLTHDKRLQSLTNSYLAFNAAVSGASGGMKQFITNNQTINNTLNQVDRSVSNVTNNVIKMGSSANTARSGFDGLLPRLLQYRAVSLVFEGITKAIGTTVQAMYDMERQAARVQRVSAPGSTPVIRAGLAEEAARTGVDVKDIGEAYYQLKTQIKDNTAAFGALQTAMNLVVGTESDARDTTRAMLQIYNQFGGQLGTNIDQAEKMRRAGELLAIMWKGSAAEVSELTQSLKYLGPIAEAARVPVEQVAGAVSALTTVGVRSRQAGTEMGAAIAQMIKNFNPATGMITSKGSTLQAALTPSGGLDVINTLRNFIAVSNTLPVEKAEKYSVAISGAMNSWRLFGSVDLNFLRIMQKGIDDATQATHGLSSETDRLRQEMNTTAQEWERVWRGAVTGITNAIDASGLRTFFRDIANDIEHANRATLGAINTAQSVSGVLTGQGLLPGDSRARQQQLMSQASILQEFLETAREKGLSGKVTNYHWGIANMGAGAEAGSLFPDAYAPRVPAERSYLRQFMHSDSNIEGPNAQMVTFDLPAMQAELTRLRAEIATTRRAPSASIGPDAVSALTNTRGLTPEQVSNAAIITAAAQKYGLDPLALIAVAHYESGLHAGEKNRTSSATGLFQILSGTAPNINRADAGQNAEFAARAISDAGGKGLTGAAAIRQIVEQFERPGAAAMPAEIAGAIAFYKKQDRRNLGSYTNPADEKAAEERRRAAEQAARKHIEDVQDKINLAQADYQIKNEKFGASDYRTIGAAQQVDVLKTMKARLENDAATLALNKAGIGTTVADNAELIKQAAKDAKQKHEDAVKEHAAFLEYYAEIAQDKYGPFSRQARQRAEEAQAAMEAASTGLDLLKLQQHTTGPIKELADKQKEIIGAGTESLDRTNEGFAQDARGFIGDIMDASARRIQQRSLGLRPNAPGAEDRQQGVLTANIADIQRTIELMKKEMPGAVEQIGEMGRRLDEANAALMDFKDTVVQRAADAFLKTFTDPYAKKLDDIDSSLLPDRRKLQERAIAAQEFYDALKGATALLGFAGFGVMGKSQLEQAAIDRQKAAVAVVQYDQQETKARYDSVRGQVQGTVQSALMTALHGQGSVFDLLKNVGGSIVDAALQSQIKRLSDPLVASMTKQILAIDKNSDAVFDLTNAITGGGTASASGVNVNSGMGAVLSAGVAAGIAAAGIGGVGTGLPGGTGNGFGGEEYTGPPGGNEDRYGGKRPAGKVAGTPGGAGGQMSDLQKGLNAGLAAYSIGSTSAQQGVNLGNFLGGVASGAAVGATFGPGGSLIGGIVGGAVDLIGGLFHHSSKPTATPQDLNPAYYNAPSNFDVAAYNYSAYGKLPTLQNVGFAVKAANVPVINVFVDGAKVAAQQEITRQGAIATISLTNPNMDRHIPV